MTESARLLVDTSAWIEYFRPGGNPEISLRVQMALSADRARVCEMVLLELRRGGGKGQRKALADIEGAVALVAIDPEVWQQAYRLADRARRAGSPVPNSDLLIFACALRHGLDLVHRDRYFDVLAAL